MTVSDALAKGRTIFMGLELAVVPDAIAAFVRKTGVPVLSVAGIREIIGYLHEAQVPVLTRGERRPIDQETRSLFDAYMETYGVRAGARTDPVGS